MLTHLRSIAIRYTFVLSNSEAITQGLKH